MKRIILITMGIPTAQEIKNQLIELLGEQVEVTSVLVSDIARKPLDADLLLFSNEAMAKIGLQSAAPHIPYLIARRVINHRNIGDVISIPNGTPVLLVNDSESTAREAQKQLIEIGLDHLEYHKYYPGAPIDYQPRIVITPGECDLIPYPPSRLIDIGSRILDIQSLHEIISLLKLNKYEERSFVTEYLKDIVTISKIIDEKRHAVSNSEKLLETILNSVDYGLAYVNEEEQLVNVNTRFEAILGHNKKDLLNRPLSAFLDLPKGPLKDQQSWVSEIEQREALVDIRQVSMSDALGYLVTVNDTEKISKLDHKIRRSYAKKIKRTLHDFDEYLSINADVKTMLKRAQQFARTDATILIQGENGTGKEILAQAIHQHSFRSSELFIPVNIAAVSSHLLESELFGYEEGSFTGALKGGKMGLFEIASGGTIFIDEIGDAPLSFQVKLLRVLEEKTIRRVGALKEIPVNVRVIAATNKHLLHMVDEGSFREDLFFRLNILPLKTIPLRMRPEDITYLMAHFCSMRFGNETAEKPESLFQQDAWAFLQQYRWRGNVRELMNLVEYLSHIYDSRPIALEELHQYMSISEPTGHKEIVDRHELWVLRYIGTQGKAGAGRKMLTAAAVAENLGLGEGKIRGVMNKLTDRGLVQSRGERQGCVLTEKGLETLGEYKA